MPTRLDDLLIRKEVQAKLAYIRIHLLREKSIGSGTSDGERNPTGATQGELANRLGISQPEISRLLLGACTPHPHTLERIYKAYFEAKYFHWDAKRFHPICALAKRDHLHAYRKELPSTMMKLLHSTLDREPLAPDSRQPSHRFVHIDLHVRAAKLPSDIEAYSFGNDITYPSVFVVLVGKTFTFEEQYEKAWDEVRAHVIRTPQASRSEIQISQPIVCHYSPGGTTDAEL